MTHRPPVACIITIDFRIHTLFYLRGYFSMTFNSKLYSTSTYIFRVSLEIAFSTSTNLTLNAWYVAFLFLLRRKNAPTHVIVHDFMRQIQQRFPWEVVRVDLVLPELDELESTTDLGGG